MTIEERAKEYSLKDFDGYYTGWEKDVEEGYIAGATEQKAIDKERIAKLESFVERATKLIKAEKEFREHLVAKEKKLIDKACKWLEKNLPDIEYITNASLYRQSKSEFIDIFQKAMEE